METSWLADDKNICRSNSLYCPGTEQTWPKPSMGFDQMSTHIYLQFPVVIVSWKWPLWSSNNFLRINPTGRDSDQVCGTNKIWGWCGGAMMLGKFLVPGHPSNFDNTVKILCIGTDRSQQTVQTKIRLLLKKQSDQGLRCLPFHQHLLDALMECYIKLFYF